MFVIISPQPRPHAMTFIDGNNGNIPRFDG
jgi:hypothetical protein